MATAKKMFRGTTFKTPIMRLSYANGLYKPRSQNGGPSKYGATLIGARADRPLLEKQVLEVLKGEWGDKGIERVRAGLIRLPFLAGDGKESRNKETGELHPGMGPDVFFIRVQANEDRPPFVVWRDKNRQETEETVYSGCFGKATLTAFAWHHATNGDGISFGIEGFQKLQEGDRIGGGGRARAEDWFEQIEGSELPEGVGDDGAAGLFGSAPAKSGAGGLFGD